MKHGLWMAVLFVGCAYGAGKRGYLYKVDLRDADRVVVVIDVSGSMREATGQTVEREVLDEAENQLGGLIGGIAGSAAGNAVEAQLEERRKKIEEARRRLISAVDGMDSTAQFNIVVFEDEVTRWRDEPEPLTDENKEDLKAFIGGLEPGGWTNMIAGVREGIEQHPSVLVVVSDGVPTTSTTQEILDLVDEANQDGAFVVHTIGIGTDHDRAFMRSLAEDNGGSYQAR